MSIMDVLLPQRPPTPKGAREIVFGMLPESEAADRKKQLQREYWRRYYKRTLGPKRKAK